MRATRQRIGLGLLLALSLCGGAPHTTWGAQVKYTYLKIGEGGGAQVSAFTSKQACQAARKKFLADWARMIAKMKKQTNNRGTYAEPLRAKCLDTLPLGFVRPWG